MENNAPERADRLGHINICLARARRSDSGGSPVNESPSATKTEPIGDWKHPVVVSRTNFVHKSLSCWAVNSAVGCGHGCRFCYVPAASTVKIGGALKAHGVEDPDAEWGSYALLRPWDERKFLSSLRAAEKIPAHELHADGNRAIMFCTSTDPYQVFRHADPARGRELTEQGLAHIARALELIRDTSTLRVRIMTRSPLAALHFDLFRTFGSRLLFGMSIPTLQNTLARVYEPHAPAPTARLATLKKAHAARIPIYLALAPTYPECDYADMLATLTAVRPFQPATVFHEPINIRVENVARIAAHAKSIGHEMKLDVFQTPAAWRQYALESLHTAEKASAAAGLAERLHSWPDSALGAKAVVSAMPDPAAYRAWLDRAWHRVSEWPGEEQSPTVARGARPPQSR